MLFALLLVGIGALVAIALTLAATLARASLFEASPLLAIILIGFAPYHEDTEAPEARERRLGRIAVAVDLASDVRPDEVSKQFWSAALLSLGQHESHYAEFVGLGFDGCRTRPGRCDPDRTGEPQSLGYWQFKRAPMESIPECRAAFVLEPETQTGLNAQAMCASKRLKGAWYRCRGRHPAGTLAGAYSGYARSINCEWAPAAGRAARQSQVLALLASGEDQEDGAP